MNASGVRKKLAWGTAVVAFCAVMCLGVAHAIRKDSQESNSGDVGKAIEHRLQVPDTSGPSSKEEPKKESAKPPKEPDPTPHLTPEEQPPAPKKTGVLSLVGVARSGESAKDRRDAIRGLWQYMIMREDDEYVDQIISAFDFVARFDAVAENRGAAFDYLSEQYSPKAFDSFLEIIAKEEDADVRYSWLETARFLTKDGSYCGRVERTKPRSDPPPYQDIKRDYLARAVRTARTLNQLAESWSDTEDCKMARSHAAKLCEIVALQSTDDNQVSEAKTILGAVRK